MKPSGSTSAKSARSAALSRSPAQPNRIARGCLSLRLPVPGSFDKTALQVPLLERLAEPDRRRPVRDRPRLHAIINAAFAEIGAHRDRGQLAEQIVIGVLEARPFVARRFG